MRIAERAVPTLRSLKALAWPTAYFVGVTILFTWPLAAHMGDSIVGQIGDNVYFVWLIGWVQKALFQLHTSPLFVPFLNYPEGWSLASTEITPATVITALPVSMLFGPIAGYNFSVLISFILSGLAVHLWVFRLSKSLTAGLIAGTVFAFSPYRLSHYLVGHLNLLGTQWIPLYFMALHDVLQAQGGRLRMGSIAGAAIFLGLIGFTSQYYLYMTLVLSCVYVAGYILFVDRRAAGRGWFWGRLGATGIAATPLVYTAIYPFLTLARQGNITSRPLEYARLYSASPTDFVLPSTMSAVWGKWVWDHFDRSLWIEASLYLGLFAFTLAVIAIVKRTHTGTTKGLVSLLTFTGLAAFVLALGTDLHWLSQPVTVGVPRLLTNWHPNPRAFVPLPGRLLFAWLPYYASMRVSMRYGVFLLMVVSLLCGLGAKWLMAQLAPRKAMALGACLMVLVLLDFYPRQQPLARVEGRPVDYWLASQPGEGAVAQFPFAQVEDQEQIYYTMIYEKPFVGGFFNAFPPPQYRRIKSVMDGFPSLESVSLLRELDVEYVVIDSSSYEDFAGVHDEATSLGLEFVNVLDGQYVYVLLGP